MYSRQERVGDTQELASLTVGASYSTKRRSQIIARMTRPFGNGDWRLIGDWRYYDFTERTYGLGSDTTSDTFADIPLTGGRAHSTLYRSVAGPLSVGVGYHFDVWQARAPEVNTLPVESAPVLTYASGVSLNARFESRDNPINATRGAFGRATLTWYPEALGSTRTWRSLQLEGKAYQQLPSSRRQVIAVWGLAWLTTPSDAGYFNLPSTGWDEQGRASRGYAMGRYRGRGWIDSEVEYRVDLLRNGLIGAAVFGSASTFSDASDQYGRWVAAGGVGLRIKLDKTHGGNLCIDYAWGRDGARGFFLALNEAF